MLLDAHDVEAHPCAEQTAGKDGQLAPAAHRIQRGQHRGGQGQNPQQDSNGYTSSFSGGSGNNGGYNGYSYSSAPQQPPVPQKKKPRKVLLRVLAGVGVVALGFGGHYVQSGAGSGVVISQDGYILTCAHVVSGATSVKVQLNGSDESYDATVVGQDSASDIAVLKINATGLTPAVIGDSDALAVGEVAVAVGNPLGTLSNTVTDGIVSALNRQVTVQNNDMTLIQTDASISPGNSGGGLFNANGELIGIVNAKSSYSEAEGIGFAIPINTAMEISRQLIESGSVARPALGVKIMDVTDAQTAQQLGVSTMGVYVVEVTKGSGAEAAGVQAGDRVLAVDDTAVSDSSALKNYLKDKAIGDSVNLQVERNGKVQTLTVTLGTNQ